MELVSHPQEAAPLQLPVASARGKLTITDVARIAGVSKKTVSRVLNDEAGLNVHTRRHVEGVIATLGYTPNPQARALARGHNLLVGLIHDNPNAQTVMNVQQGMLEALRDTEFEMVVRPIDRRSANLLADLRAFIERQRLFGVLLMPPLSEDDLVAKLCEDAGCRYVRMGSAALDIPARMVASNDREGVREATRYLIELGHRRIALVAGPSGFRSASERRLGFEEALAEAGIDLPRWMVGEGDYRFESGQIVAERLLELNQRPTAILACNDEMAGGVVHAARLRGLDIPGDLSVVGFDDTPIAAQMWPPLTTVRWPVASMARAATNKLVFMDGDCGRAADEPSLFASTLIRRESTSRPACDPPRLVEKVL